MGGGKKNKPVNPASGFLSAGIIGMHHHAQLLVTFQFLCKSRLVIPKLLKCKNNQTNKLPKNIAVGLGV
jgi:hypothetical protein